ncbi:MAG: DUF1573 domain-containing protein [Pirellula sp.]
MRTLLLTLACIGIGFGIAKYRDGLRNGKVNNVLGMVEDMEATLKKAAIKSGETGKIEVLGGSTLDFGTMKQGSTRMHKFVFKNVGGKAVKVEFRSSSCKCTVGNFKEATLEPGEQTDVELKWFAEKGMSEFAQTAVIGTDAPGQEEIKLTIKGKIGASHAFSPADHDFGDFLASDEHTFQGKLYSFEQVPMSFSTADWSVISQIKNVSVQMGEVRDLTEGQVPEFADARQVMDFTVTLKKGMPAGRFEGNVTFRSSADPDQNELIYFPMRGRSVSILTVVGGNDFNEDTNTLSMGAASTRQGLKKSILLKVRKEDSSMVPKVKVLAVTPPEAAAALKITIGEPRESAKQNLYPITMELPPGTAPVEMDGTFGKDFAKIVLETNIESAPQFPIFLKFKLTE